MSDNNSARPRVLIMEDDYIVGLDMVDRLPFLKDAFMAEARGESGEVPRLLQGSTV